MKKIIILGVILLSLANISQAQKRDRTYNYYYIDSPRNGTPSLYATGVASRNDTLFVELQSIPTIIGIRREGIEGSFTFIALRSYRERKPLTKKDEANKPKAEIKDTARKATH